MPMRLDQLGYFVAAVECGSISQAARHVRLAQPALSAHIKALEQELGTTLFLRSTKGVTLTESGRRLYEGTAGLFRHVEQLRDAVTTAGDALSGEVRIVFANSLTPLLAGQIFTATQRLYPDIRLTILDLLRVTGENILSAQLADFGLLPNAATLAGAASEPVLAQDLYLVGRDIPGITDGTVPFRDLHRFPLVMGGRRNQLRIDLENTAIREGHRINVVSEQDSLSIYRSIIVSAPFYTVVPYSAYASEIEAGYLMAARITSPSIERTVSFVWQQRSGLSVPAEAVRDLLRTCIADMVNQGSLRGRLI